MANIYLLIKDKKSGPYTDEQVKRFLADGLISPDQLACRGGLTDWVPISKIGENCPQCPPEILLPEAAPQAASTKHLVVGDEGDYEVECPHCRGTVIVNDTTGIYVCAECGGDIKISLACPKCGAKREVKKWSEDKCSVCGTSFDS